MGKYGIAAAGLVAACMALSAPVARAGDGVVPQVYTFQVEVDVAGALSSIHAVDVHGDATSGGQLQRELSTWRFERTGTASAGDRIATWVRVTAIPAHDGVAARILSASAGPVPDVLTRPAYPAEARRLGREGVVVLELALDASGAVQSAAVRDTFGQVDRAMASAALGAARDWSFRPERINGAPQAGKLLMPVCFTVSKAQACEWTGPDDQAHGRDAVVALAPAGRLSSPAAYAVK